MNFFQSLKYLKNNPPNVGEWVKEGWEGSALSPKSYADPEILAEDLKTTIPDMLRIKGIDPRVRAFAMRQLLKQQKDVASYKKFQEAEVAKFRERQGLKQKYAGSFGEEE